MSRIRIRVKTAAAAVLIAVMAFSAIAPIGSATAKSPAHHAILKKAIL
jgi:hypothetical protein